MALKSKAVAALVGFIVLGIGGVAFASGRPKSKKKRTVAPIKEKSSVVDDDDITETDDDIEVVLPDASGEAETGASLIVSEKEAEAEELLPDLDAPGSTPVDKKLADLAAQAGQTTDQAVDEILDTVTDGQNITPLAVAELSPELDPNGTVKLAKNLLARETLPHWKTDMQDVVANWQSKVGLKDDGQYGIKSAAKMALEVGFLPLVRYWPKGTTSKKEGERSYDAAIEKAITEVAKSLPDSQTQIDALNASMRREVAVSFGTNNPPIQDTSDFVQDTLDGIAEAAELKGEKELQA